jgi:hypothetical protein
MLSAFCNCMELPDDTEEDLLGLNKLHDFLRFSDIAGILRGGCDCAQCCPDIAGLLGTLLLPAAELHVLWADQKLWRVGDKGDTS